LNFNIKNPNTSFPCTLFLVKKGGMELVSVADLHWGGIKIIKHNKESIIKLDVKISSHTDSLVNSIFHNFFETVHG